MVTFSNETVNIKNRKIQSDRDENSTEIEATQPTTSSSFQNKYNLTKLLKAIYNHMEQLRYKMQIEMYKKCTTNEWLLVAILIDKILFFIYCFIVILCTTTLFK